MRYAWAFAPPLIIGAAIDNHIFDALAREPLDPRGLAAATGASERGVRAVADALVGFELLSRDAAGRYVLAEDAAAFLVSSSPAFHGSFFGHITRDLLPHWMKLSEITRSGEPATHVESQQQGAEFFEQFVESLFMTNYPAAKALAAALDPGRRGEHVSVLDVAAGSGVWGIAQAQASKNVHVTAVDWERVLSVTRRCAEREGVADRFRFQPGDILEADLGTGHSIATLGHILHSEGEQRSRALLKRIYNALASDGTIVIAEFLTNSERSGPPQALIFAVNMLVHTREGTAFSFEQIASWLVEAGFRNARTLEAPAPSPLILADK
jgi:ubiquinone/menaquinone biosynthesis C-methylase UbiE